VDIQCGTRELRDALVAVAAATGSKKDVMSNVLVTVLQGAVELYASDNEASVMSTVIATTGKAGEQFLVPPQRLTAILNEIAAETVTLSVLDNSIRVHAAGANFRLSNENADGYPPRNRFDSNAYYRIPGAVLRKMIRRTGIATGIATGIDSTRYALCGVLFEFTGDGLVCAGTDSGRLAVASAVVTRHGECEDAKGVVPNKALKLLDRVPDSDVEVALSDRSIHVRTAGFDLSARLVEGRFPRYRDVIPKSSNVEVMLPVPQFFAAIRQSLIVTDEENRGVDFLFDAAMLTLKSQATSIGESKIEMPIAYDSDEIRITFDPKYIADFLKVIGHEATVNLSLTDSETAAVFRVEDSYTYVIMPLAKDR
jgi:DNA polymerase-3 subunit beta